MQIARYKIGWNNSHIRRWINTLCKL